MKEKSIQDLLVRQIAIPQKLFTTYREIGLDEEDVMIILHIHRFLSIGHEFPTPTEMLQYLQMSEEKYLNKLRALLQKNLIEIKELHNEQGKWSEAYSLDPLWNRLLLKEAEKENEEGKLFELFEQEIGRPLSPFEIETISVWLDEDKMKPAIIISALRESVLMGKLNFKYIDRILREWKRKGLQTTEQVKTESEAFHKEKVRKQYKTEQRDTSVYYNWLKDGGK